MVDSSENILVEFDYNNIAVIDPNKVIDENGRAKERLVKHENLVMYANLECKVLPRTKLLVGASNADNLRTIAVTDMNFLNPGKKTYLDTKWTDEITGKDTIEGKGVNQRKLSKDKLVDTNKSEKWFYSQSTTSNKEPQAVDNGTLGIKSIQIKYGTEFLPQVTIRLEDVKGRTLFEAGNDSPYAAFFNLPYPLFYLTVKGFYGKAMRLPLMLQDFNCSYNPQTSNFDIDLTFLTYKFTVLSEVKFAHLLAVPHMYTSDIEVSPSTSSNSDKSDKKQGQVTLGFQKIKEVFTEYKAKGLIDKNFPDMTVYQLKTRLDTFIQTVLDSFIKQNIDPITNVLKYIDDVNTYRGEVYYYGGVDSWFKKYCDPNNFFILKRNKQKIYPLLIQESDTQAKIDSADSDLKARIDKWNEILKKNKTLGQNGGYKINNIEVKCEVLPNVVFSDFVVKKEDIDNSNIADGDIDYVETFKAYSGNTTPADSDKTEIKNKFTTILQSRGSKFYVFEGKESFVEKTNKLIKDAETKKDEITTALSQAVSDLLKDKNNSLGFVPTIRNVMAVIYASAEAFLRLQEEVHTKAWEKRNSAFRKAAIFNVQTAAANKDAVNTTVTDAINDALKKNVNVPVYPWPTFLIETSGENGQEKFQPKYPADNDVIQQTRADQWDEWPEVEFVEEYVKGLKFRLSEPTDYESSNEVYDSRRLSTNPIEFPPNNEIYSNQEETKYFYEIYERLLLASFYTKLNRSTNDNLQVAKISKVLGDVEKTNIIESLVGSSPFLQNKLLTLNITGQNYENLLLSFSNDGVGQSWQNFLRGIFNTSYINNYINTNQFNLFYQGSNPTEILGLTVNGSNVSTQVSFASEPDINEYITQSSTNKKFDFTDLYPFTEASWCNKNLPGNNPSNPNSLNFVSFSSGNAKAEDFYDTRKTLNFNPIFKTITNFKEDGSFSKPIVNYNYSIVPTNENDPLNTINQINNINNLENFYNSRSVNYSKQFPTEGNVNYSSKPGLLTPKQTTSILNTPFFINSMQESVQKFRNFDPYPFTVPAYLFLNSLPLSTLREKFSDYTVSTPQNSTQPIESVTYSDFIYPSLKKFAAIHKLPFVWILKIGSIWHRYKKWIDTGVDMLDSSWKSFDYISNFDPITSAKTTDYALTLSGNQNVDIILEKETLIGNETYTQISTGFYPQLINDFNVILQGYRLFSGYTNTDVQEAVTSGLTILNSPESNYTMGFSGDPSNNKRLIQINSWSVVSKSFDGQSWYLLPSHGALVNQVVSECFKDNKKVIEVSGNTSMYDGSVRTFWNCPNYGYFDLKKLVKPKPDEYMKKVFAGFVQQENFSLNGKSNFNTLNSEIFTLFSKEQLDYFEEKFLDYSRDKYSYIEKNENANRQQQNFSNFHRFFISMMRIDPSRLPPVINDTELIFYLQQQQLDTITNQIRGLMDYNIFLRLGNPSNFNRPVFYSFSNRILPSTFVPERYVATTNNALPNGTNGQTIANSLLQYPNEWKTLYKYVGYSEIPGISYTDTGSTIFDFFFDFDVAFNSLNIEKFSTIIKMYATQKKLKPNYNQVQFSLQMDEYINNSLGLLQKSINDIFPKLKNELAVVTVSKERQIEKTVDGEQTKLELWEVFKATNDKWIAGTDFKNKTLYEDVLFLDRASRDLGQKVVVDIYKLSATIDPEKNPLTMDTLDLVSTMCSESKFQSMFIPAYINFYGINEVSANAKPKPEGSLELANTLFGNFTNVDYRESSTKMVNFYAGPPSVQLDTQGVIDGFKNDSFDLRRVADNPLIENQIDKKDHATSNKVVGFNVDIGPQNQGIFKSFRVSQKNSTPTAESLEVISQMASQAGNRGFSTQSLSLYNLYKIRSYTCEIDMMGNALMQPLMYFNLRYVPMFTGPYLITNVDHTIDSTGNFNTKITGIRQPIASYDIQVDLLQSIKTNLVEQVVKEKVEELKNQKKSGSQNVLNKSSELVKKSVGDTDWNNTMQCTAETTYRDTYVKKEPKKSGKLSGKDLKQIIEQRLTTLNYTGKAFEKLKYALYSKIYIEFNKVVGGGIQAFENNFTGIDLLQNWYSKKKYLEKSFFCVTRGTSNDNTPIPYAVFKDVQANIDFTIDLWGTLQRKVDDSIPNEDLAILITTNNYDESTWNSLDAASKKTITDIILEARNDYNSIVI